MASGPNHGRVDRGSRRENVLGKEACPSKARLASLNARYRGTSVRTPQAWAIRSAGIEGTL